MKAFDWQATVAFLDCPWSLWPPLLLTSENTPFYAEWNGLPVRGDEWWCWWWTVIKAELWKRGGWVKTWGKRWSWKMAHRAEWTRAHVLKSCSFQAAVIPTLSCADPAKLWPQMLLWWALHNCIWHTHLGATVSVRHLCWKGKTKFYNAGQRSCDPILWCYW